MFVQRYPALNGVIMGLVALASGDSELVKGMEHTLLTLGEHQGPHGEMPSNVTVDGARVSYGQLVGRVDALLWYVIGVCAYHRYAGDGQMRLMRGEGITNSGGSRSITMGSCTYRWAVNTWRGAPLRAYWHTRQFGAGEIRCLFDMPAYGC